MNVSIPIDMSERLGTEPPTRTVFERAMRMIYTPKSEWPLIATEEGGFQELLFPFTLWIVLAPALIATLLPMLFFSALLFMAGGAQASLLFSLWHLVLGYLGELLVILVVGKGLSLMAAQWNASTSWLLWCRVLIYGSTSYFLSGLVAWIPFLGLLFSFACAVRGVMVVREGYQVILKRAAVASAAPVASADPVL